VGFSRKILNLLPLPRVAFFRTISNRRRAVFSKFFFLPFTFVDATIFARVKATGTTMRMRYCLAFKAREEEKEETRGLGKSTFF